MDFIIKKLFFLLFFSNCIFAAPTILEVKNKTINVNGKDSKVFTIEQPDGTWGYYAKSGDTFNVIVKNKLSKPTVIHWHGILLPNDQDGVELTQKAIAPNGSYHYQFKLKQSGTYWMHSHFGFQEQKFAEAPLIIDDGKYENQATIMFQDFSFKKPETIMADLENGKMDGMDMSGMDMSRHIKADLNDIKYDAFLTNYQTPQNPQVYTFKPNSKVRLRFINGASSTNFWINLGKLKGTIIAVDGEDIKPVSGYMFPLAIAQRMDIVVKLPNVRGIYPILGQVEGLKDQTGILISTNPKLKPNKINSLANNAAPALNYISELKFTSLNPLPVRKVDKVVNIDLGGNMQEYVWTINNQVWPDITPIQLKKGDRVELDINNKTMMMHPIHLHGNVFEVVSIDGKAVKGALRDTVFITPNTTVKVIFDANEPGKWMLHCHMLYHMHSGMMTYVDVK